MRALVTAIGLGANRPQDAVYPTSLKDADGKSYDGSKKYVIHFEKDQTPPVQGFWSITMYDDKYFFVENPINRYSISARQNLKKNTDGSTDILHPEGLARCRQGIELVASSRRQVRADAADVLAEREQPFDPQWHRGKYHRSRKLHDPGANVRSWHLADIGLCAAHVRFWGRADMTFCAAHVCF